jgi:hypothetical protein
VLGPDACPSVASGKAPGPVSARGTRLANAWRGARFILPKGHTMLLGSCSVFRKQDETLAHLQKLNALLNIVRLFCGIGTGFCLIEI